MNDIKNDIEEICAHLAVNHEVAKKILEKAKAGGEIDEKISAYEWINHRLIPNTVYIGENDYARMCVDALKILSTTVASDYGSSRQRDMGQL